MLKCHHIALSAALLVGAASVLAPARADEPTLADKASARDLFNAGMALRQKGDKAGALAKFKAAYALWPSPSTGVELGRTHMMLGELIEARERFLETAKFPEKSSESSATKTAREDATKLAEELAPKIPSIVFALGPAPAGATVHVSLDGRELPAETLTSPRKVNPGTHAIVARATGTSEVKITVEVKEGETREVPIKFGAPAASDTPAPAPSASPGPAAPSGPPADTGSVAPAPSYTLVWVGFGIAAVGVVAGATTGLMASSKASTLSEGCTDGRCPPELHGTVDSYQTLGTISTISFVVAGIGAGIGIYGLVSSSSAPPKATARTAQPWLGLGAAGIAGTF